MDKDDLQSLAGLVHLAPARWAEAKRRAAVVRRYLSLDAPTMAETAAFAAELGLARTQFRTLARSFATSAASERVGGGRHHLRIDSRVDEEISNALERLGNGVSQDDLHAVVSASCTKRGISPPSISTVRRRRIEACRPGGRPLGPPPGRWLLDHVELDVLIERDGLLLHPTLVAILHGPEAAIRGFDVDVGISQPVQGAKALVAAGMSETAASAVELSRSPSNWSPPETHLLAMTLGGRIGRVPLLHGDGRYRAARSRPAVVSLDDLRSVVSAALTGVDDAAP